MKDYKFSDIEKFLKDKGLWGTQVFFSRNIIGDPMETIYDKDGVIIDHCRYYCYLEVFGLNEEDENKLEDAYAQKREEYLKEREKDYDED